MTKKTDTIQKVWWGNRYLLLLTAAASTGTFIMQVIQMRKG